MKLSSAARLSPSLDPKFPLAVFRVTIPPTAAAQDTHDFQKLVVVAQGMGYFLHGEQRAPITAGDVFLVRSQQKHGYADTNQLRLITIAFRPRPLKLPVGDLINMPGYQLLFSCRASVSDRLHLNAEQLAEAQRLIVQLEQELRGLEPGYRFTGRVHLMQIIAFLSRCYSRVKPPTHDNLLKLAKVLAHLDRHLGEHITSAQLTAIAGMSESTLFRTFHQVFQRSPIDYLIRLRIQKACELLANPELRIADIGRACGFNDGNYFARQFHHVMGCSPRVHRARNREAKPKAGTRVSPPPKHAASPIIAQESVRSYGSKLVVSKSPPAIQSVPGT